ncbi:CTP synthetase [Haloferax sp. DFSO60]|uniref:DUF7126 family protein n=1 Tax=Haloferax sp. DFSO60 TaxID=3388652 RepID=UPI0039792395
MIALIAGPDGDGLGEALEAEGVEIVRLSDPVGAETLAGADVETADLFVLTDMADATAISVAKELNSEIRIVTYSHDSLPEFAKGQADLAIDPNLLAADVVAEELV